MIWTAFQITLLGFAVGGAGLLAASLPVDAATRRARLIKFATYFAIVHTFLLAALLGRTALAALFGVIALAGGVEMVRALPAVGLAVRGAAIAIYAALAAGSVAFAITRAEDVVVYVYLVVAAFDGFSQVSGQLGGRIPLAPRISPGKTLEGFVGGALLTIIAAVMLRPIAGITVGPALLAAAAIVPAALIGDLAASWFKRKAGVKDFSLIIPGHGGVLDRFDSLIAAAPVAMLLF